MIRITLNMLTSTLETSKIKCYYKYVICVAKHAKDFPESLGFYEDRFFNLFMFFYIYGSVFCFYLSIKQNLY